MHGEGQRTTDIVANLMPKIEKLHRTFLQVHISYPPHAYVGVGWFQTDFVSMHKVPSELKGVNKRGRLARGIRILGEAQKTGRSYNGGGMDSKPCGCWSEELTIGLLHKNQINPRHRFHTAFTLLLHPRVRAT